MYGVIPSMLAWLVRTTFLNTLTNTVKLLKRFILQPSCQEGLKQFFLERTR
jgi:hypothetical protein